MILVILVIFPISGNKWEKKYIIMKKKFCAEKLNFGLLPKYIARLGSWACRRWAGAGCAWSAQAGVRACSGEGAGGSWALGERARCRRAGRAGRARGRRTLGRRTGRVVRAGRAGNWLQARGQARRGWAHGGAGHGRPGRGLGAGWVAGWASLASFGALCTWLSSGSVFGPGSTRYFLESPNEHCSL